MHKDCIDCGTGKYEVKTKYTDDKVSSEDINIGNPISIQWDIINKKSWIVIKDCQGYDIMRFEKGIWDAFEPHVRDGILDLTRRLFG